MTARTAFFHDERCLWHNAGLHSLVFPVGGWVQPPSGRGHAESPETKRRMLSLMQVSGLVTHFDMRSAPMATEEDLLRVHPADYLARFKALSDTTGGDLGDQAAFGPGGYEIAKISAGLAKQAVDDVISEAYVPFCGHAVLEAMTGVHMGVEDPGLASIQCQQPNARFAAFQRTLFDELAVSYGV